AALPDGAGDGVFCSSLRYPVFVEDPAPSRTLWGCLDPLAALDPARTFFAFNPADAGQNGTAAAPIETCYCSPLGKRLTLQPLDSARAPNAFSRLVFASAPVSDPPSSTDPLYLAPMGDFALAPSDNGHLAPLMAGLSGVEYMRPRLAARAILTFYPGHPGFVEGYIPAKPIDAGARLRDLATTSWAYL